MKAKNALSLLLAAGMVAPAAAHTPTMSPKGFAAGAVVKGHIYVNMATGEKIATVMGETPVAGQRGLPPEVWVSDNGTPCAAVNSTGVYEVHYVGRHDDPADTDPDTAFQAIYLSWGDVPADTVVDTIQVATYADHADVDADSDGLADGVEGLACFWNILEGDNGFNSCNTRIGLISIGLIDIPGNLDSSQIQGYIYTLDLAGDFDEDISFEIGDTDNDPQGAAVFNPEFGSSLDADLDFDGLVDFAYTIQYIQPGVLEDDMGNPIGDPTNRAITYSSLDAPRMELNPNPPTTFTILPISAGSEDAFDVIADPNLDDSLYHVGTFWYGGFTCDDNGNGVFEGDVAQDYNPWSSFFFAMYAGDAPGNPCPADLFPIGAPDGVLNFFDLSTFISYFNDQNPLADFFPVGAPDGLFNFFDLSTFISDFNAGCP